MLGRVFDAYQNMTQIGRCLTLSARLRGVGRPRVLELSRRPTELGAYVPGADVVRYATHVEEEVVLPEPLVLPFDDDEFDGLVVTDAYEHVSEEIRQPLLAEMLRVTRGIVLLGCPHADPVVTRFDRVVFDFIWGKYGEVFEPLLQHRDYGLEPLATIEDRFIALGAERVAALPCNYVYRWIHQLLVYFDLQHRHPHGDLFEAVNRAYNEHLSPYDYREPCYRYLLVVPTDPDLDLDDLTVVLQGEQETPAAVAAAEGVMIEAFRAVDARTSDRLRGAEKENERLLAIIEQLQADNLWALDEIALLRRGSA
jgi:hypothetical protein